MKKPILLIPLFFAFSYLPAQQETGEEIRYTPRVSTIFHKLGEQFICIKTIQYGPHQTPIFINVHDDEATSVAGARKLLEKKGGLLIRIENKGKRNIRFRLNGSLYTFDPNRIFSREGIVQTLTTHGKVSKPAIAALEKFARRVLDLVPENPGCIIALHNNTDGKFSVNSYFPGQSREKDARLVYAAGGQDDDDIFLTTDSLLFHQLIRENYNAIWQDNEKARKDGSLSIYFGEKNIAYLNCETEHGRISQYHEMILAAGKYLYAGRSNTSKDSLSGLPVNKHNLSTSASYSHINGYTIQACFPGKKTTGGYFRQYNRHQEEY